MMYKQIVDPKSGKKISTNSLRGKIILAEYLAQSNKNSISMIGGGHKWNCEICTYENENNVFTCEMCNSIRKLSWQCPKCTVINACGRIKCRICQFKKPSDEKKIIKFIADAKKTRLDEQRALELKKQALQKKTTKHSVSSKSLKPGTKKILPVKKYSYNLSMNILSKFPNTIPPKTIKRLDFLHPIMENADKLISERNRQMINPIEIDNFQLSYYELPKVQHYVRNLSGSVSHWVKTRGDGNCFYTSFAFGLLNFLLSNECTQDYRKKTLAIFESIPKKKNNKLSLEDLLLIKCDQKYFKETIWNNSNTVIATYIRVTSILRIIVKNEFKQQDIFGLMQETLTRDKDGKENITFGIAIVRLLRVLAFKNLKINRKRIIGGITLESIIEGSFNKNLNKTKQMGEEADLNMSLCLSHIFGLSIKIHELYTGNQKYNKPKIHSFFDGNMVDTKQLPYAAVHISYRKGHYDGLIPGKGIFTPGLNIAKKHLVEIMKKM